MILRSLLYLLFILSFLNTHAQSSLAIYGGVNYVSLKEAHLTYYTFNSNTAFPYYQTSKAQPGVTLGLELGKSLDSWILAGDLAFRHAQIRPAPILKVGPQVPNETKIGLSTLGVKAIGSRNIKSSGFSAGIGLSVYYLLKPRIAQSSELEYNILEEDFITLGALVQIRYEFSVSRTKAFVQIQHFRYISQSQVEVQLRYNKEHENTYRFKPLFHLTQISLGYLLFNHDRD